jgi:hypothetical protein
MMQLNSLFNGERRERNKGKKGIKKRKKSVEG